MRLLLAILATIAAVSLCGCGQTGPLHLPDQIQPKADPDNEFDVQPAKQRSSRQP
jgi:predicted small lipoprotein YifL